MQQFARRAVLTGTAAFLAAPALASPSASPLPRRRPGAATGVALEPVAEQMIQTARLGGQVAYVVADAYGGEIRAARNPDLPLPPASVAKAITTAYALEALGAGHRFDTRLIAVGPLRNGRLEGDLVLAGGGAPGLDSSHLATLAAVAKDAGLREITGAFRIWSGALPYLAQIDPAQPPHVGYNPAISGLNLNYNRVHLEWRADGGDWRLSMDARTGRVAPQVGRIRASVADRRLPVYLYDRDTESGRESWSIARSALGTGGARWLPVRDPGLYAGEVFRTLARSEGIDLPEAEPATALPAGATLAMRSSPPLAEIAKAMLRFSTNLTAEVLGLSASMARSLSAPADLAASGAAMSDWAADALGMRGAAFVDHSGLGGASRVTATDLTAALIRLGPEGPLRPLLKRVPIRDDAGQPLPFDVAAKTGTLNFVSALAGYISRPVGDDLVFAILTGDVPRRAALSPAEAERPPGGRSWAGRSRQLQYDLVALWGSHAV